MKGKKSAGERIGEALKRSQTTGSQVTSLPLSRIESQIDALGRTSLRLIFPRADGDEPYAISLDFMSNFQHLQEMFGEGMFIHGYGNAQRSRIETRRLLEKGLFAYLLRLRCWDIKPEGLDEEFFVGLNTFICSQKTRNGEYIASNTVGQRLGAIRSILGAIKTGQYADVAGRIAGRVPTRPAGSNEDVEPTDTISLESLLLIIDAAESEVVQILDRFEKAKQLIKDGQVAYLEFQKIERPIRSNFTLEIVLAVLHANYAGLIPGPAEISLKLPLLGQAVKEVFGHGNCVAHFYPTARHIIPFVVLLTIATIFNPDTVLPIVRKKIVYERRAGIDVVRISGPKGRAAEDPVVVLDTGRAGEASLGLKDLLDGLEMITARIRPYARSFDADKLFLFVQEGRTPSKEAKSFGGAAHVTYGPSGDITLQYNLKRFIAEHGLPAFTLSQLRPTLLGLIQILGGSLEAAQEAGFHRNALTTWMHYSGSNIRKLYRAKIGGILLLRERWWQSKGVLDPRARADSIDKGAATPGFDCLDPFDSPRPNQIKGKLCKDYGGCPNCPLAAAHPNDPMCVSMYVGLEFAIHQSRASISSTSWIQRWMPVLCDLKALLDLVPAKVLNEALLTPAKLPKVG